MTIRIQNGLNLGGMLPGRVTRDMVEAGGEHIKDIAVEKAPLLVDVERANREERPGTLRESAYVRVLDDLTAEIGFSDFAAAWQHERTDYHHDIGQSNFLGEPLTTEVGSTLDAMAAKGREEGLRG